MKTRPDTAHKIPIKTHVIVPQDNIVDVCEKYAKDEIEDGDILLITSKIVSITQNRIRHFKYIYPGFWANLLWRFVSKPKFGIGAIGLPEKMQAAIDLVGLPKVILASAVTAITRYIFKRKGDFFRITGHGVAEIDGSRILTFEEYCYVIIYGPINGDNVAQGVKERLGCEVAIIDAGNYGDVDVLGISDGLNYRDTLWIEEVCSDNPLGQTTEQTPIGILRKID
jgi:hypothetical protein